MSEHQKNVHELAPFISEALRELAGETAVPDADDREWSKEQKASHQYAKDIAEAALSDDVRRGNDLIDDLLAHAEDARDAAMEEKHE